MKISLRHLLAPAFGVFAASSMHALELKKGDHVAIVGSGLADRQQHFGWLEAFIHRAFPDLDLTFRNLGFAGDEFNVHPRSDEVPPIEYFLNMKQGDVIAKGVANGQVGNVDVVYKAGTEFHAGVILAYWGFNESFKGEAGLGDFKSKLDEYLKGLLAADFGSGRPRVVLFSPIAHENLRNSNFGDGEANNRNIAAYSVAMGEVAKANAIEFVDLFAASRGLYLTAKEPLTINGVHLNQQGDQALAAVQFKALFSKEPPSASDPQVQRVRLAVLDKNREWHHRYRTVDQYNIYGGRSRIKYEGVDNATILGEEMAQRDVKTANRDQAIWAVAKGGLLPAVKDDNLPLVSQTPANRPQSVPYMSGEEAINHLSLPPGCKVELVADETRFPELVNPVQMNFDTQGRLWVAAWPSYPETTPTTKDFDKLLVFDLDPKTGKASKCTTYLDGLNCPTGFQFYKDGVIVMQSPDLWFARDTNMDGKVDSLDDPPERILHGLDAADSHHETNSICYEPGGALYLSDGVFHRTSVETLSGPVRNVNGAIYRFEPLTSKFERYVPYGFANPHGRVFDAWGNDIITDATGNANYFGPGFSGFLDTGAHPSYQQFWVRPSRPCPGTHILSSRHFPDEWQGEFLNTNVISFQGIFRAKISEEGSGLKGETIEPALVQTDIAANPNFRPSGVTVAPDGSIYFMDWSQMLIGHLQHHLRDPNRDHQHGRIYRITYPERPLLTPKKIYGESITALLELLKEPENDVRLRAKIELSKHSSSEVVAAVKRWTQQFDPASVTDAHHLLEALWVHQWHNVVNVELIHSLLKSPDHRARAQAVRVVCYQRDRIPDALALLRNAVADESMRVRLEAVRAASFFRGKDVAEAIAIAQEVLRKPTDYYIDYCFKETLKQLQSLTTESVVPTDPALLAAYIAKLDDRELLAVSPANESVLFARLERKSYDAPTREKVLSDLAKLHGKTRADELLAALGRLDVKGGSSSGAIAELAKIVATSSKESLLKDRAAYLDLASKASQGVTRKLAYAALLIADSSIEGAWEAAKAGPAREALIQSIAVIVDPAIRGQFQPKLADLSQSATGGMLRAVQSALPLMGAAHVEGNFALLAKHVIDGRERASAANAIMQIPRSAWKKEFAAGVSEAVLSYAKTVPAEERAKQSFVELNQFAMEIASLVGNTEARRELRGLGVPVFVIKTVPEQMRYDVQRVVVESGKPFEIIFENPDVMPHNLVVVAPGKHMDIGMAAATMGPNDNKDKQGRTYLPKGHAFIDATKLIEPGGKQALKLEAISKEGSYEFVCTFPGHAALMWGTIVVTKDVEAYLAANPVPQDPSDHSAAPHKAHASR